VWQFVRTGKEMRLVPWLRSCRVLPYCMIAVTLACFATTYGIAVAKGDVYALFPYISDTGGSPPESCIFSLGLNTTAFIGMHVCAEMDTS
jgi:hypothetical protein